MIGLSRSDNSVLSRWWWTVDRWMLLMILALMVLGLWLAMTASPAVAEKLKLDTWHFVKRQGVFLGLSICALLVFSMLSTKQVRRVAVIAFPIALILVVATLFFGDVAKGATRQLRFGGIGLQPSEFLKPFFVVVTAWLLSANLNGVKIPAKQIATGLYIVVIGLLVLQPDFGQSVLISAIWFAQMALAGLPIAGLIVAGSIGLLGLGIAYATVDHVEKRINAFLFPSGQDTYQIDLARDAFGSGGLLGKGPGEGVVKVALPDAHTDFIFAVVGEELGAVAGVMLIFLFAGIVMRGLANLLQEENPFRLLAAAGLIMQFGVQVLINIGVNVNLLPNKGMTLPFISYGGSSMLALAIGMGMVLALTRRNRFIQARQDPVGWKAAE
ncbi:MAG: cell division protein FtsW [Kordiimonadales bacterium]|nr:MAG: cell division protein FtsW [Kordiimonadales bacterium]